MATMPPSMVYSVSNPSGGSMHILSKHTVGPPTTITHTHTLSYAHLDRQAERHGEPLGQQDRAMERPATIKTPCSSAGSASGPAVSMRACSPPLSIHPPGRTRYLSANTHPPFFRGILSVFTCYCSLLDRILGSDTGTSVDTYIKLQ